MVAQHRDLPVALRGQPVELNDAALADERLVAVPRIVAALESEQRAGHRRHFDNDVFKVMRGTKEPQSSAGLAPALVHVDKDGDDLAGGIGVDPAVATSQRPRTVVTVGRPERSMANFSSKAARNASPLELIQQALECRSEAHLIDGKAAGRGYLRVVGVDRGERRPASDEPLDDQMGERLP